MRLVLQRNHFAYLSPTSWKWLTLTTGGKLSVNLLFFFASASGLCFSFIKLFLSWPMGFSPSCWYPWSCWGGEWKEWCDWAPGICPRSTHHTTLLQYRLPFLLEVLTLCVHSRKQCSSLRLLWFLLCEKDKNDPVAKFFCKSSEPLSVDFLMSPLSDDQISANWLCFHGNHSHDKPAPFNSRWLIF